MKNAPVIALIMKQVAAKMNESPRLHPAMLSVFRYTTSKMSTKKTLHTRFWATLAKKLARNSSSRLNELLKNVR